MRFLKYIFLFILAFFALLPVGAKYGLLYFLEQNHVDANINDVDINLFAGIVGIEGVHIYGEDKNELHLGNFEVNVEMLELINKRFLIEHIKIDNFKTTVVQIDKDWNVGGIVIPLAKEKSEVQQEPVSDSEPLLWSYGVKNITFNGVAVQLDSLFAKSKFSINQLQLSDIYSWLPEKDGSFDLKLAVNNSPVHLSGKAKIFSDIRNIQTSLKIEPLQIQPFLVPLKDMPFNSLQMAIYTDLNLNLKLGADASQIDISGIVGINDINAKAESNLLKLSNVEWNGKQNLNLLASEEKNISLAGSLSLDQLYVEDKVQDIQLAEEKISWNGDVNLSLNKEAVLEQLKSLSTLDLGKFSLFSPGKNISIAEFGRWKLQNIELDGVDSIKLKSTSIDNIILLRDLNVKNFPPVLAMNTSVLESVSYTPEIIEIGAIELKQFKSRVVLNQQGKLSVVEALTAKNTTDVVANTTETQDVNVENEETLELVEPETEAEEQSAPKLLIHNIIIDSGSELRFTDNSVTPVFETHIHKISVLISDVNQVDSDVFSNVTLKTNVDDYGKVDLKGKLQPFKEKVNAEFFADLKSIELVPFSSYAGKFAGLHIKRGMLDANADVKVKNNLLAVKNDFYFNQLNIESDESETSKNFLSGMPMPLDLTLDVLRDNNNVIQLQIPVKGSIDEPDFSLKDVYNKAMVKALKFAATRYLTQAVQPLGLIMTAGELVGKAMAPRFEPLVYAPGSEEISSDNRTHIKNIAKLLQDRDKIRLTLCGIAAESDWQVMLSNDKESKLLGLSSEDLKSQRKKMLLKLANDRTKVVKNYFVTEYKIDSSRLFTCNGKVHKDEQALPQLDISL